MPPEQARPGPVVLVVDDDAALREAIVRILAEAGYRTAATGDPDAVVALAAEHGAALVLVDLAMPGTHGYALAARLRRDPRTRAIPVLFLTTDVAPGSPPPRLGPASHLPKPFTVPELRRAVGAILGPGPA